MIPALKVALSKISIIKLRERRKGASSRSEVELLGMGRWGSWAREYNRRGCGRGEREKWWRCESAVSLGRKSICTDLEIDRGARSVAYTHLQIIFRWVNNKLYSFSLSQTLPSSGYTCELACIYFNVIIYKGIRQVKFLCHTVIVFLHE